MPLPAPTAVPLPTPTAMPLPAPTAGPLPTPGALPVPLVPFPMPTAVPLHTPAVVPQAESAALPFPAIGCRPNGPYWGVGVVCLSRHPAHERRLRATGTPRLELWPTHFATRAPPTTDQGRRARVSLRRSPSLWEASHDGQCLSTVGGLPALRLSISHLHSAPKKHNGGTVTPDVRAPEGSRVSEVSGEGVRLGVSSELRHILCITQLQSTMKHNETTELCLLCAYYLRLGACALLAPCSPQTVLSSKLRTVRHLVTALSHSHSECLRRSLGHTSSSSSVGR